MSSTLGWNGLAQPSVYGSHSWEEWEDDEWTGGWPHDDRPANEEWAAHSQEGAEPTIGPQNKKRRIAVAESQGHSSSEDSSEGGRSWQQHDNSIKHEISGLEARRRRLEEAGVHIGGVGESMEQAERISDSLQTPGRMPSLEWLPNLRDSLPLAKNATPGEQLFRGALEVLILERRDICDAWRYLPTLGSMVATVMRVAADYLAVLSMRPEGPKQVQLPKHHGHNPTTVAA